MRTRFLLLLALLLAIGCADAPPPTSTPAPQATAEVAPPVTTSESATSQAPSEAPSEAPSTAEGDPLYLAIIWHQHQPVYYKNPETNSYVRPWVRVHATKDYVDMASILNDYPTIKATFNLTPSLLRQILDLSAGARDDYWNIALVPADELTAEQQQYLLDRFFDINRTIIARFPRYQELLEKRDEGEAYSTADYRDLQIMFNLGWVDPDWLAEEPLASLVAKGRDFSEADKVVLFDEHLRLINEVIPIHKELQDKGQIEVTMTPYAHPILPLLVDTNSARIALPELDLPNRFVFGADAQEQVRRGVTLYEEIFGRAPLGMWPAEGAVSQQIISMVADNGIQWMATDEGVLANSLGFKGFTRNSSDTVQEADTLYRPYYVQGQRGGPVAVVFRDVVISDRVGFIYSGMAGDAAAQDFMDRIHAIRAQLAAEGAEGPHLVSVILDGENAWEYYPNDGKEFLHGLYSRLSNDPNIITVTPSEFLAIAPEQPQIETLWAGSWISHDFATWIGEEEENTAWNYLLETREFVRLYESGRREAPSPEALAEALDLMYIAEGSDWFWWYGADQNSGNDESFDQQFRDTLAAVYRALGVEPPAFVAVPIIPERAADAARPLVGLISPTIDGTAEVGEWDDAGLYLAEGGVMASADRPLESVAYGFDATNFYLNITFGDDAAERLERGQLNLFLKAPGGGAVSNFSTGNSLLGFAANRLVVVTAGGGGGIYPSAEATGTPAPLAEVAIGGRTVEVAIPLAEMGNADVGDVLNMRLFYTSNEGVDVGQIPSGPAVIGVPDLGNLTVVLDLADPERDDYGPGTYTYPGDAVFAGGNFDIVNFQVGYDDDNIVFKFTMRGPVNNHWNSPNGLSGLTLDVYIDTDGDGQGGVALLPGRNLALAEGYAWDYAIHAEGWTAGIYTPGAPDPVQIATASQFFILADPGQQKVTIRVPKALIGDTPEAWRYAAVAMGQEGFPSSGVWRVRDVSVAAEQWRFGGAPAGATNHTRVLDLVWPTAGAQEEWLSAFTISDKPQTQLTAEDFGRIEMFGVE